MAELPIRLKEGHGRIRQLEVFVPFGHAGRLVHDATYLFSYGLDAASERAVSLTMPVRTRSYERGALFPPFEMNLPEGYVRHYIAERLRKFTRVDDMLFLALAGSDGIGRISYRSDAVELCGLAPADLADVLGRQGDGYFAALVERYLLRTSSGIGGIQPKVVVPESRGTAVLPSLIVKAAGPDFPDLAPNEYLCMRIARAAGLRTPEFWLSEDRRRFVMRRFDLSDDGGRLGMEDFSGLTGRPGDRKYEGSYEHLFKAARLWAIDLRELFEQLVASLIVGNGDAHLKNFAVLYGSPTEQPRLSPLYDVVCTAPYGDRRLALTLRGSRAFPDRATLERFGRDHGIPDPAGIIERLSEAAGEVLREGSPGTKPELIQAVEEARQRVTLRRPLRGR